MVFSVIPLVPFSKSCDFVVFIVPPLSLLRISTSWCDLLSPSRFVLIDVHWQLSILHCHLVTLGAVTPSVWGLMAGTCILDCQPLVDFFIVAIVNDTSVTMFQY